MKRHKAKDKYYNEGWFGKHPNIYDKTGFFMKFIRGKAAKILGLKKNQRILDIATGTGAQALEFVQLGHNVIGIDLDKEMLLKAKQKIQPDSKFSFIHGDATVLPFESKKFDLAVISFAIHDVPYKIGLKILSEARRLISDAGTIYIIDYEEPKNTFIAKILYRIALLYESPNYKPFIQKGLEEYFKPVGLKISRRANIALGGVQLVSLIKA